MSDPRILAWRQQGKIHLWHVRGQQRNYPGWHCYMTEGGRASIVELLGLMSASEYSARRAIAISTPSPEIVQLPGADCTKWTAPAKWVLEHARERVARDNWEWSGDLHAPHLTVGTESLQRLHDGFRRSGKYGDYCVHADDQKLHGFSFEKMSIWFWPA